MQHLSQQIFPCNDAELLTLLAANSEDAFKLIYDQHHNRIYQVAMRYLRSEVTAEEVVQDVFMKLWLEREKIKAGTPIEAWLYTVAKNNTINRLKKVANEYKTFNRLKLVQDIEDDSTAEKIRDAECQLLLSKALKSLSGNQLKVYQLAREEKLSYVQIAEHLNISPLTVKTHMSRALGHLKTFFTNHQFYSFLILLTLIFK